LISLIMGFLMLLKLITVSQVSAKARLEPRRREGREVNHNLLV
jgi:hypothetical protein